MRSNVLSLFKDPMMKRSDVMRRRRMYVRRRRVRRLSLSVCRVKLEGATWLLLLLRPHGKRIEF
jgi:hypothetical protein